MSKINKLLRMQVAELEKLCKIKDEQIKALERTALEKTLQGLQVGGGSIIVPNVWVPSSCQHDFTYPYQVGDFLSAPKCRKCGAMGQAVTIQNNCGVQWGSDRTGA
jgi:hypothetical protein